MKIVVVDGYTLNPGDLSWEQLKTLGPCQIYDRTPKDEVLTRCKNAEIVITNKVVFDRNLINSLPKLKYIGVLATGYNVIDIQAAQDKGIIVTNVPIYGTDSVSQMVFALLLELTQNVGYHSHTVYQGRWSKSEDFCYWDYPMIELVGLTMGIVGFGRIGATTAKLAKAFGMKVLVYDIMQPKDLDSDIKFVDLNTIFLDSDVISLHCPLTPQTQELINAERLAIMKESTFLINTSRGPLVNEQDLADALNTGRIAGAGLDVLSTEPPGPDNPLLPAKHCFITPHIAWATRAARARLMNTAIENVKAFLQCKGENVVS